MPPRNWSRVFSVGRAAGLSLFLLAGCGESTASSFSNLSANNNQDSFLFIAQTFGRATTTTLHYVWPHSSAVAQVSTGLENSVPIQGTARLIMHDPTGKEVFNHDLKENGVDTTATGTPGDWTIDVSFASANGDIVFQAQKATRNLTVTNVSTGPIDADGYIVTLDGSNSQSMGVNASVVYNQVTTGSHTVVISGLAGGCTVSGSNTNTLTVPAAAGATVSYSITCT